LPRNGITIQKLRPESSFEKAVGEKGEERVFLKPLGKHIGFTNFSLFSNQTREVRKATFGIYI